MKLRRLLFWSILVAAILSGIVWVLHVPYKPENILSAVPAEATLVSIHNNLAEELDPLLKNQLVRNTVLAAGVGEKDLADLESNKVARVWISRLAADRTVIAYVPALGYQRKPAWVFASWIGNQSQKFRWKLFWFRSKSIRETGTEYGRVIYGVRTRFSNPKAALSLSLTEGVLVGCLSEDPTAVRYLVQAFDHQHGRSSVVTEGTLAAATALAPTGTPHWGWVKLPRRLLPPRNESKLLVYGASIKAENQLQISFSTHGPLPAAGAISRNPATSTLLQTLGASPDGALILPVAWLRDLLPAPQALPLWAEAIQPLFETNAVSSLSFISILNRDHCGRIRGPLGASLTPFLKGLRVPTLLIGVQVADEQAASIRMTLILDRLNSRYGLGLIPHPIQTPSGTVTLIEESRKNLYGKFEPDERIAWTCRDGWLFLASNAAILKRLIAAPPLRSGTLHAYAPWASSTTPASASLWINADAAGKLVKDALSAVTLSLLVRNAEGTQATRRNLEVAKAWIEKTRGIRELTATAHSTNGVTHLELTVSATPQPKLEFPYHPEPKDDK